MNRSTDGSTRQPDDQQPTHLDADARRVMALPTKKLPDGAKLAWLLLWVWCGSRPSCRTLTVRDLIRLTGADRRTVWDRIRRLEQAGLILVEDRDRRKGQLRLHVYRVPDYDQQERPDPQQLLALGLPEEPAADSCIQETAGGSLSRGFLYTQSRAPTDDDTSYPRAHACAPAVDDVDVDVVVSSSKVADIEIQEARSALQRTIATWKAAGIPEKQRDPQRRNLSNWLKTHTLMVRGRIARAAYDAGVKAVIAAHNGSGIQANAWAVMWGVWKAEISESEFNAMLRSLELPAGWEDIIRGRTTASTGPLSDDTVPAPKPNAPAEAHPIEEVYKRDPRFRKIQAAYVPKAAVDVTKPRQSPEETAAKRDEELAKIRAQEPADAG